METTEALVELLRLKGLKITPQRRAILGLLRDDRSHPTAEVIYRRMLVAMPDVSRTTVYNTLRELVEVGALAAVEDKSEGGTRYDTNTDSHHHLSCIRCRALIDLSRDFKGVELPAKDRRGYRIVKHQITFYGYCPDCQAG